MINDDLRARLDKFVIGLLNEAEACDTAPANDTDGAPSEDNPAPAVTHVSLTERVQVLKAATAWWNARAGKRQDDEPDEPKDQPGFVRLRDELKRRERR